MTGLESADLRDKLTHPLKVEKKIQETPDAYSFRLEIPEDLKSQYSYLAGQFVTLFLTVNGEEVRRSYSLCTSPYYDDHFQVTVKQVPGGKGSNYLANEINTGDTLYVTPPQGTFFQQLDRGSEAEYFLFAAGSGITPIFSIAKEVLSTDESAKVNLLFANRDEDHIIYNELFSPLLEQFKGRLHVTHQLSQPKGECEFTGRCDAEVAANFAKERSQGSSLKQAYICGPDGFMNAVKSGLENSGFSKEQIRIESFATAVPSESSAGEEVDGIVIGDTSATTASPKTIRALINGEQVEIEANPEMSILESLINAGQNPPYSCMDGACMACMAKVTSGKVVQDDYGILTDENVEQGEALTCQARAISETVVIDYDNL